MQNVLIVEDNEQNRALERQILKANGYQVWEAADGVEGLRMIEEHTVDVVLLDIQMPLMDGFEVLHQLRDNPKHRDLKVIAVTSFAMKGDREKALEAGFNGYVTKPLDTRALPEIVKKVLSQIHESQ
ncbi:MAG: response regulator [Nitrospirae bacterium]|nr:response regulator [Nitrospirota bacterium]MBF0536257.1 response regulator [Nitrospirota bacterium]MBF0615809.1 response regulator [Nitrospirota bacterium]